MQRFLLAFVCLVLAGAAVANDKEECQVIYRNLKQFRAEANGELWQRYAHQQMTFEDFDAARSETTIGTDDNLWRINRASHLGTAEDCRREDQQARAHIREVLKSPPKNDPYP